MYDTDIDKIQHLIEANSNCIIVMVGLPRSGKSTFVSELKTRLNNCCIISPDTIRLALHGREFLKEAEDCVWLLTRIFYRSAIFNNQTIIVDATNTNKERRSFWTKDVSGKTFIYINMLTPLDICLHRATDKLIPVIKKMSTRYEPTTANEGFVINIIG